MSVRTSDGWQLQLHRVTGSRPPRAPPVLLLHGFGANGYCLLNPLGPSLGHYLARHGFDVWMLEFRGARSSHHPQGPQAFARITVDDKILQDLPVAVDRVRHETGTPVVDLVAFSLGGTIAYAYLSHFGQKSVRRMVALAAPLRFRFPRSARLVRLLASSGAGRRVLPRRIPMRGFTQLGAATNLVFPARDHFNLANVDRTVLLEMMRHGTEDAPLGELLQLVSWSERSQLLSLDGRIDYGAHLGELNRPLLLIGASADRHVTREALAEVLSRVSATEKRLLWVGRSTDAQLDYGHTDLLLGTRATTEVFPHVEEWLRAPQPEEIDDAERVRSPS